MTEDGYYAAVRNCLEGARNGRFCVGAEDAARELAVGEQRCLDGCAKCSCAVVVVTTRASRRLLSLKMGGFRLRSVPAAGQRLSAKATSLNTANVR